MTNLLKRLLKEENGQGMVEYGLIIALVSIVVIIALRALGTKLTDVFENIESEISA